MNVNRTRMLLESIIRYPGLFGFLLRDFIERQRVLVYPVERVFLAEIRGKDDQVYAVRGARKEKSGTEMIVFVTQMINWVTKMTAFAIETVNSALSSTFPAFRCRSGRKQVSPELIPRSSNYRGFDIV